MAKFKITGLPKAQGGLIVNDPLDPRLKAYNDSLSLYNRFPMPRDKSHFWPIRTKEESTRLAKDFGTGNRILPVGIDSYDAVLRNGLYYHKPIFKKPKLKVTLEEKKIEDLRLPINPINTADIEAMMSPMPRDIIQAPVRRVPNDSIVPPASKEIWKTLPDGTHYRVERPVDPRLTKPVKIGFYQKGGTRKPIGISDPKEYKYRKQMYDDSLALYNYTQIQKDLEQDSDHYQPSVWERLSPSGYPALTKQGRKDQNVLKNRAARIVNSSPDIKYGLYSSKDKPSKKTRSGKPLHGTRESYLKNGSWDVYHPKIKPDGEWLGTARNNDYSNVKPVQPVYLVKENKKTKDKKDDGKNKKNHSKKSRTVINEISEIPVTDFSQMRLPILPPKVMETSYPNDIVRNPLLELNQQTKPGYIVPPASKEVWLTTPDGQPYRVERPVDPRLTKKVKIGFYQEGGQLQPGYYKYKHKPEASYKYDGNQWYISNEGTKGNYQPIEDPNGTRSKTLAKGLEYGTTQFYAPLAENVQNQTAFPQVSQKSIQTSQQNLNADLANQQQAVDNLTEYHNRKRNQTDYNVRDLPEEKGWYYNQGETLKGVADESVGDVDSETAAITALSGDAEEAVQYIMSDPNYNLPANNQGLMQAREMVKYWTPQQVEQFVAPRREAYLESEREGIYNQPKSKISFDAPENPTFEDYASRAWDITMNPIDAFNWSTATGDVSNMPWNMRQYENAKAATGSTDITDDNLVGNALDFLSYFTPAGLVGQGIKMIPQTNESVNRLMDDPTWSNAGTAAMDVASNAMMLSPLGRFTGRGFNPRNFRTTINNTKFQAPSRTDMVDAALNIDPRAQQSDIATAFNTVTMANDLRSGKRTNDNKPSTGTTDIPELGIRWPWSKKGDVENPDLPIISELLDLNERNKLFILDPNSPKVEFDRMKAERLAAYDTPEGRRRIQKHIDDNKIMTSTQDPGNSSKILNDITDRFQNNIQTGNYEKEDQELLKDLIKWGKKNKVNGKERPGQFFSFSGLGNKTWNELTLDDLKNIHAVDQGYFLDIATKAHKGNTAKTIDQKITVDEYIGGITNIQYNKDALAQQSKLDHIDQVEQPQLSAEYTAELDKLKHMHSDPGYYDQADIDLQENTIIPDIEKKILDLKITRAIIKDEFEFENAGYKPMEEALHIGRALQTRSDLRKTMAHEFQHGSDLYFWNLLHKDPKFTTTKINKDLIKDIKLSKEAPEHLRKKQDENTIMQTSGTESTNQAIWKSIRPQTYFNDAKEYWSKGRFSTVGDSNEPVAFVAEVREGMLMDGVIKNLYDDITPDMLKNYYKNYTDAPLHEKDFRLFDIMENSNSNFRSLSKHMNNLQALAPYLIGAGGIGTMLSGAGEEEEPEMKMGGIVIDLDKSSIDDYVNQGYIVVEE